MFAEQSVNCDDPYGKGMFRDIDAKVMIRIFDVSVSKRAFVLLIIIIYLHLTFILCFVFYSLKMVFMALFSHVRVICDVVRERQCHPRRSHESISTPKRRIFLFLLTDFFIYILLVSYQKKNVFCR